jgi:cytidyltransferase-like protein
MREVIVTGAFDDLRSPQVRFLQEAARLGRLTVILWPDREIERLTGGPPKLPFPERKYFLEAVRYVDQVKAADASVEPDALPYADDVDPEIWAVDEASDSYGKRVYCASLGLGYKVIRNSDLLGWPESTDETAVEVNSRKKVLVTGCYDWLHSGHIRFFEEASQLGDLYVAVGHDANIRLLKGERHPFLSQDERCYMVKSIRYVRNALVTSGQGWLDAEPEISSIKPDIYAVNEDGDRPEKRQFCQENGIQYFVLKRTPKEGLPRRESTALRGF